MTDLTTILSLAIHETAEGITVADLDLPDAPLVFVNQGFATMTGYTLDEMIGKNCRLLQGPETSSDEIARIRTALLEGKRYAGTLLNYRKDGTPFWNSLSLAPVTLAGHRPHRFYVGIQSDVTGLVAAREHSLELARLLLSRPAEPTQPS